MPKSHRIASLASLVATSLPLFACGSPPPPAPPPVTTASTAAAPPADAPKSAVAKPPYPLAAKKAVTTDYGVAKVTDDYAWLEPNADANVKEWVASENSFTRSVLDRIPERARIHDRVAELHGGRGASYAAAGAKTLTVRGKQIFVIKRQPPKQQPFLVVLTSLDDTKTERVVLDPNALDGTGKTTIDFFTPSLDGKLVAVSLSEGGTEDGSIHVFETATGKERTDIIPSAQKGTGGGSVTWNKDGSGFWYTRYPHKGERPDEDLNFYQQVYFHKLGTSPEKDVYALGKDAPRIAEFELETSHDGQRVLAKLKYGDGGEQEFHLLSGGTWQKIASKSDNVLAIDLGKDGFLYALTRAGAPHGKIVRTPLAKPALATAETVLPESDAVIAELALTKSKLYTVDLVGGPSQIRVLPLTALTKGATQKGGATASLVAIPAISSVDDLVPLDGDDVVFTNESYIAPPAWYRLHAADGKSTKTALAETSTVDYGDIEVVRETATSKDGTKVPMSVMRPKGAKLDGSHPVFLTAYGGYGLSRSPRFRTITRIWLDQGGVFAEANLRGGGEFGDEWHHQGYLTKKQNVFDDFDACLKSVVDLGYTKPEKIAIYGGSNGGLLMGAALTQHPEHMKAVVSLYGIYDMARVENEPNGAFNVTEFGTMKDPEQAKAMLAYSPFHNVKDGAAYPATLFIHGDNDPRVAPWQSRKMTARLQAATGSSAPILLRTHGGQGHVGASLDQIVERDSDVYAFLFHELGITMSEAKSSSTSK